MREKDDGLSRLGSTLHGDTDEEGGLELMAQSGTAPEDGEVPGVLEGDLRGDLEDEVVRRRRGAPAEAAVVGVPGVVALVPEDSVVGGGAPVLASPRLTIVFTCGRLLLGAGSLLAVSSLVVWLRASARVSLGV